MIQSRINKWILIALTIAVTLFFSFSVYWMVLLKKAHSTFENYYAFRGCVQLLEKNPDSGTCKISSGQIIKIVKINNQWYLDGDGPGICEVNVSPTQGIWPKASAFRRPDGTFESRPLEDMAPFLPREELRANMHLFDEESD